MRCDAILHHSAFAPGPARNAPLWIPAYAGVGESRRRANAAPTSRQRIVIPAKAGNLSHDRHARVGGNPVGATTPLPLYVVTLAGERSRAAADAGCAAKRRGQVAPNGPALPAKAGTRRIRKSDIRPLRRCAPAPTMEQWRPQAAAWQAANGRREAAGDRSKPLKTAHLGLIRRSKPLTNRSKPLTPKHQETRPAWAKEATDDPK